MPYETNAFIPQGGPLQVSFANYQQPASPFFAQGMSAVGIEGQQDLNSGKLMGHAPMTVTINPKLATRSSSEASFLQRAIKTTSLKLYKRTMAKRILFDESKRATGVIVEADGEEYTLFANNEIIVSAGAVSGNLSTSFIRDLDALHSSIPLNSSWSPALDLLQF